MVIGEKLTLEQCERIMKRNVGGSLYLRGTQIKELPSGLTVGGSLYLGGTQIKELPEGLTVGVDIYSTHSEIPQYEWQIDRSEYKKVKLLRNGDYVPNRYIYCDGILTHVKKTKKVGGYTLYIGKIKGRNVISDGTYYAHCKNLRDGIADIAFKRAKDRGAEQYKGLALDTVVTLDEAKTMYRVITGACRAGTEAFAQSLGETLKERYTVREMIEVTKGQYNAEKFAEFFEEGLNAENI